MSDIKTLWSTDERPDGQSSPYRRTGLATARGGFAELRGTLDVSTDNLNTGDIWYLARLPADFILEEVIITVTDMDSASSLTLTLQYDDSGTPTDLNAAADAVGQTGGTLRTDTGLPLDEPADVYNVQVEVTAGAGTAVAGTCDYIIRGTRA